MGETTGGNMKLFNLKLFDGEGGGGESSAGEAATGAEKVVYGKQPEATPSTEGVTKPTVPEVDPEVARQKEFDEYIKNNKDLYEKKTKDHLDRRFKNVRDQQQQLEKTQPLLDLLSAKYDVEPGNADAILQRLQADDELFEKEALEHGMSTQQWKDYKTALMQNRSMASQLEQQELAFKNRQVVEAWKSEIPQVQALYPEFDFDVEMENPEFGDMVSRQGKSLLKAYQYVHHDDIVSVAVEQAAKKVSEATAKNIHRKSERPLEGGVAASPGVTFKNDVTKLTAEDRRRIAKEVRMGKSISF